MLSPEFLKKLRQIELHTRKIVNTTFVGEYRSTFKGTGMEFVDVREYLHGDDIRAIDWKVTARMDRPYVKKFVEERELTVILLVDASGSGNFGTRSRFKLEQSAQVAATLAFSAVTNSDKVGLLFFTDRVERYVPPRKGKQHVLRLVRDILMYEPERRRTDPVAALEFVMRILKHRAIVFLLSDFLGDGFAPEAVRIPLGIAARKHDLVAIPISEPAAWELPHGPGRRPRVRDAHPQAPGDRVPAERFSRGRLRARGGAHPARHRGPQARSRGDPDQRPGRVGAAARRARGPGGHGDRRDRHRRHVEPAPAQGLPRPHARVAGTAGPAVHPAGRRHDRPPDARRLHAEAAQVLPASRAAVPLMVLASLLLALVAAAGPGRPSVSMQFTPPARLTVGDPFEVTLVVNSPSRSLVTGPEADSAGACVAAAERRTTRTRPDHDEATSRLRVAGFKPGRQRLPRFVFLVTSGARTDTLRSEERRVGKEGRS